ncbi:NnrS family protein [Sulfuricurvum sp.]|uniref:NnrS family protein n=1 Tax=Sulfuricurvum sp. TaxID=2025608 RepID=UPI00356560F4
MITFSTHPPVKPKSYFLSQPHQPFFLFGLLWAILSMVLFILSHKGIIILSIPENEFHLYTLAFIVFAQLFHGFLFTTFPRFCTSMAIPRDVYVRIVWLYQLSAAAFFIGALTSSWIVLIAMIGVLFAHAMALFTLHWVYKIGQSPLKQDPYWILVAHGIGIAAHTLWIIAFGIRFLGVSYEWLSLISPVIVNLFLIFLTFSVAQRMIPFFSHSIESRTPRFVSIVFVLFVLKTLFSVFAFSLAEAIVSIFLSLYLLKEFLRWKLPLFRSPAIVWVLHLALFWLPIGLFIGACAQILETVYGISLLFMGIHLLVLGFLTTVLIGFGTRVTLGHSGQPPHADALAISLFWWTQVVLLSRIALSVDTAFGSTHPWIFDIASATWIVLFIVWGWRYGRILVYGKK